MENSVVELKEIEPGIALLTMQDRVHKNTFSKELVKGLISSFEKIRNNQNLKVVILTGFDTYFASGGTQEALLEIHQKEATFTDGNLYSLALDCPIPVISAMQGHGIGGGFVMGLFADFVILSRKSIYTTNFMKYGFTPGMGATLILPVKLGLSLTQELLMTAENFLGEELQQRGIPFPVLPRNEVVEHAMKIARSLSEKPRTSLITLKDHLVAPLRRDLQSIIKQELLMHEKTFHQPEVKEKILSLFGK
ncbi:MAG: enoyl-CoA hydratase/isomerase family protein [Parachlamydiaceae bacterium]|nr:enoyl-CoA hydratase/isomerase family protein [Parachlamydiaceae bacterium]